ncbi:FAD binding domain-containing protein [Colletotrichum graminicola M1.001]|uniref:FAD binding domain-containing protein n=1 Tax=Colletotrichum graminicola (strain M1.001 / M2 / FGSC 10212) TaxID=645133 RepID=E3QKM0_COLGM|nr:FAD binding domain-containing protein [Colletotrichum graminicola M1.001]EFQ31408.1 FAD binding domain-containing protein [Colletotrichum graminicola M1.001]
MQLSSLFLLAASTATCVLPVAAHDLGDLESVLEPEGFNVSEAVLKLGVAVAEIPPLEDAGKRLGTGSPSTGCSTACASLKLIYGDTAVLVAGNDTACIDFIGSYWSAIQAEVRPRCIFQPSKPEEVSVAVLLARLTQCPFAVKSGGHAAMAGASNAEGGITVSFTNMKSISLSADRTVASIQPGNVWGDVYAELTKSDVTVIGGRLYNIGVGGLITGGGIAYSSGVYGWACDNVESFDVVISSGAIIRATATQFPDFYWALRGGGNNFGIVVGFNLFTHPLPGGRMWGGTRAYTENSFPQVAEAFANMVANAEQDPRAGLWHVYTLYNGSKISSTELYYAEPDGNDAPILSDWNAIPAVSDTTQNRVIAEYARVGMDSTPPGLREVYAVISTKASIEIVELARDIYFEEVTAVVDLPGIVPVLVFQGISVPTLKHMQRDGGNALGLEVEDGPFYIIQVPVMWSNQEDDDAVYAFASRVLERINGEAEARGLSNDYVYMNYGSQYQDVISGYGAENKDRLKRIAKKYDPREVFQKLQPGYFKLDRAPLQDPRYFNW